MSEQLKSIIGARVKAARKVSNLTQAALAEAVDRITEAISNIERSKSLPPLDVLAQIAALTGFLLKLVVPRYCLRRERP